MAKNYRDNFDYSEAIANSTSKAERDRLLAERQNKIDAEGLTGRVADNSAVSTWTKGYRPYYVASASSASKAAQENAERCMMRPKRRVSSASRPRGPASASSSMQICPPSTATTPLRCVRPASAAVNRILWQFGSGRRNEKFLSPFSAYSFTIFLGLF